MEQGMEQVQRRCKGAKDDVQRNFDIWGAKKT